MEGLNIDPAQAMLLEVAVRLFVIVLLTVVAVQALRLFNNRLVARFLASRQLTGTDARIKARTVAGMVAGPAYTIIFIIAGTMALRATGFDVTPLIASAGIAGIAIGFGAQALVRDILNGFFIALDDLFTVDDYVRIGEQTGQVERLTFRMTQMRNSEGALITIPNGEIKTIINLSRQWARVNLDLRLPMSADADDVTHLLSDVLARMAQEPEWSVLMLEPPSVLGMEQLAPDFYQLRVMVKTPATRQAEVAREIRSRVQRRLRAEGIVAPAQSASSPAEEPG